MEKKRKKMMKTSVQYFMYSLGINQTILQREQEGIKASISEANRGLTWDDTRRMPLTGRVHVLSLKKICIFLYIYMIYKAAE